MAVLLFVFINSSTYAKIQEQSDIIWKNQRFHLISEYIDLPILPVPFSLLIYTWNLITYISTKLLFKKNDESDAINSSVNVPQTTETTVTTNTGHSPATANAIETKAAAETFS